MNNYLNKNFCPRCGTKAIQKMEGDVPRNYCEPCAIYLYSNPLPVASSIVSQNRRISLVKRKNEPYKDMWCLPSGFVEIGESIEEAALRELEEETGIKGHILGLIDVDSCSNYYYGDLIFLTFEVEQTGGRICAGDDATDVRYFSIEKLPELAFESNSKAVAAFSAIKKDYWAIIDSFSLVLDDQALSKKKKNLISDNLVLLIEKNSQLIAKLWLEDVMSSRSTPSYHHYNQEKLFRRVNRVISHFGKWLEGTYDGQDIRDYYINLGEIRSNENFGLSEIISALSLIKKDIWEFALSQGLWQQPKDIYMTLELERRMSLFFDKATYYVIKGYEAAS